MISPQLSHICLLILMTRSIRESIYRNPGYLVVTWNHHESNSRHSFEPHSAPPFQHQHINESEAIPLNKTLVGTRAWPYMKATRQNSESV